MIYQVSHLTQPRLGKKKKKEKEKKKMNMEMDDEHFFMCQVPFPATRFLLSSCLALVRTSLFLRSVFFRSTLLSVRFKVRSNRSTSSPRSSLK